MFKTVLGIAAGAFILKRCAPDVYEKTVQAASDIIDMTSDICTAARGQVASYTAEAAQDAAQRLQAVDPDAVAKLRQMLDGAQQTATPAPRRAAPRRRP